MVGTSNLGFPRIGFQRELKKGLERYWANAISLQELLEITASIRLQNWQRQHDLGIEVLPSNDFSLYDHVLDTIAMVGAIPQRYRSITAEFDLDVYFAMARGVQKKDVDIPAMEMTKWFNTNYHHIVPEIEAHTTFSFTYHKILDEYHEALKAGFQTRPVLLGPLTFLLLSKSSTPDFSPIQKLDELIPVYQLILSELFNAGAEWVQVDEPMLVKDLPQAIRIAYQSAYQTITASSHRPQILLASYFDELGENFDLAFSLPVEGVHLDMVSGREQWERLNADAVKSKLLSLGVVDGRNIWRTDLERLSSYLEKKSASLQNEILIAPSCSLLHVPLDVDLEAHIDQPVASWLAFAVQKLEELSALAGALNSGRRPHLFSRNRAALESRRDFLSQSNSKSGTDQMEQQPVQRKNPFSVRKKKQSSHLHLPLFPTTTIGSFPQTAEVRQMRSRSTKAEISQEHYHDFLRQEIARTIQLQEQLGLDVLVHGEFERNDMVQYFAERLHGFVFTENGWVQSFGSRYVRPPILFGNVERPQPMTVEWSSYAQSLTSKPVKGMLTGPVTILQWSFVRDDQPRSQTCFQIAAAINAEVLDLEKVGIRVIQIDEPALREGLPLKKNHWQEYLDWAVKAFHLACANVADETQIHTHMCYSEFNEIIASIAALDADVISIEAARSSMELLNAFSNFKYPNEIGPGIYDIHSPRVPMVTEMVALLEKATSVIPAEQLWVNPDCGLKTRNWQEVLPALQNMISAAQEMRNKFSKRDHGNDQN